MKKIIIMLLAALIMIIGIPVLTLSKLDSDIYSINALFVKSWQNEDFPSMPNLSAKAMRKEINDITQYALEAGYNAILFEVRSEGDALYRSSVFPTSQFLLKKQGAFTFFDPLGEMIKSASKKGLSVYAVVDPYSLGSDLSVLSKKNPAVKHSDLTTNNGDQYLLKPDNAQVIRLNAKDLGAMAKRYNLGGIIIQNIHVLDGMKKEITNLLQSCRNTIKGRTKLGVMLPDEALEEDFSSAFSLCNMVITSILNEVNPTDDGYSQRLKSWQKAVGDRLIPMIDVKNSTLSAAQMSAQSFAAEQNGINSRIIGNYSALLNRKDFAGDILASMSYENSYTPTPLNYAPLQELSINRPTDTITVSSSTYFIMGTSDPAQPLTLNWKSVERNTTDGVFGIKVSLAMGTNTFTLQQGNNSKTVTIKRSNGSASAATTVNVTSMTPRSSLLAYNDVAFSISCVAPAGKTVTATLGDTAITLNQTKAASPSVPATFWGTMKFSGASSGKVKNLGPITYQIDGGECAVSGGNVYLLGTGATPFARVIDTIASVFPDSSVTEGHYKSVYKAGVVEEIIEQMGEYYKLASGGYIKKAAVEVVDSTIAKQMVLSSVSEDHTDRAEQFVLGSLCGVPYTFEDDEDGTCTITLHQASSSVDLAALPTESELFSSISWSDDDNALKCVLIPRSSKKVWGIDILNQGNNAVLYVKKAPAISSTIGKPLENLVVVLDPGHGGSDTGAPSVLGLSGPNERDVNLANAKMLKMRLEQLGATVVMTREDNETKISLYDRMEVAQNNLPDFFLSIHHNSVAESVDANLPSGVESYFYEPFGSEFGESVVRSISNNVYDRDYRFSEWGYYIVTRMRYTPSILCEIGFVPNPVEFRNICDISEIYKTANAITVAMLNIISET